MKQTKRILSTLFAVSIVLVISRGDLLADDSWRDIAEPRVRSVYERREWNDRKYPVTWLPDSSGYLANQFDPKTRRSVRYQFDPETGETSDVEPKHAYLGNNNRKLSPDERLLLEARGRTLLIRDLATDQQTELIRSAQSRDQTYGKISWSPDGQRVLFVETDHTDIKFRSMLIPSDPSFPQVQRRRFARVGGTIARLRVGVIQADGTQLQWIEIDQPEEGMYLGQVDWAGNSQEVVIEKYNRFRSQREFLLVNLSSNEKRVIYEESNEAWVDSSQQRNQGLIWIRDGAAFIVITERDGWRHAYLYSREGEELSLLTPGEYDIIERAHVDEAGGWFYFYASPQQATQTYLYRVPLDGSGTLRKISLDVQPGTHDYQISPDAKWAIHTYSTFDSPAVVNLIRFPNHQLVRELENNNPLRERVSQHLKQPSEFVQINLENGVSMDAWMLKPHDFDETRKYPVFVYVYGEPHLQTVLDRWGAGQSHFLRVIADLGYIVVSIDNRGTPAPKGAAWRRSVFGSLGPLSTEDQAAALQELARTHSYIDLSRVGIWGWSGGGSNTLNAMFRKPDVYHVGIAVVPKPQPHLYNAWFQEIYMQTPEVNSEGYQQAAPINFTEGLEGKLLIMTGSGETNTHIQIIEGLVDRLIQLGKQFDYMVYPNRDHGLREGRGTEVHVRMRIIRYLVENLPRGPR